MPEATNPVTKNTKMIKAVLSDGTTIFVQAQTVRGEEDVLSITASFQKVMKAIEDVAQSLTSIWEKAKPSKASVELGVDFAYESGELMAMFVNGSATASMKITLEWSDPSRVS